MRNLSISLFVLCLLFPVSDAKWFSDLPGYNILNAQSASYINDYPDEPVEPYPDNIEREIGDNGFSQGFGITNHAYSFDWFDSHMHLAWSHYPNRLNEMQIQEVMDRITQEELFASIDLHNNTGQNTPYGCISVFNEKNNNLYSFFNNIAIVFPALLPP